MKPVLLSLTFMLLVPRLALEGLALTERSAEVQSGPADVQAQIEEIKKMERDRLAAGLRKDIQAISAATAEDYVQIDPEGMVLDRAATLQRIKSSYAQLQSNPVDDMVVRMHGNTAVLTARVVPRGSIGGKEVRGPIRYSRVYVKGDGRLQVVLFQQTRIAQEK